MHLEDVVQYARAEFRDGGLLVRTGGDDDVRGFDRRLVGLDQESPRARPRPQRPDSDTEAKRSVDGGGVALQKPDHLVSWGESLRVIPLVGITWQLYHPVGELEGQ